MSLNDHNRVVNDTEVSLLNAMYKSLATPKKTTSPFNSQTKKDRAIRVVGTPPPSTPH